MRDVEITSYADYNTQYIVGDNIDSAASIFKFSKVIK